MLNRYLAALFLLPLAACGTPPNPSVSSVVATAIADAKAICNYVPDAEAIAQVVAAGDPLLATGSAIATAFCKAISTAKTGRVGGPLVGSVVIDGIKVPYTVAK
jgi:hypothetical protein